MAENIRKLSLPAHLLCAFVYLCYRSLETLCRLLPLTWVFLIGRIMGWLASFLLPKYRRLAERNLTIAFGREMNAKQIRALTRRHFIRLGANLLSSLKIPWMSVEHLDECVEWCGLEHARGAREKGHGVIFALLHMGNWEILSQMESFSVGGKPATLFQQLGNPYLNRHIAKLRARTGCTLFDRKDGFFGPTKWLRNNDSIGVLVDQHAGDGGVWAPFFDKLASTTNLVHLLALRSKAPIFPVSVETIGTAKWRVSAEGSASVGVNADQGAANLCQSLEKIIRKSPEDWFWVHDRWKIPNPNFLLQNYKRGIVTPPGYPMEKLQPFEILVRSPNWLGDACMAVPAVRAIKRGRPDARITILSPAKIADAWKLVSEVDAVIEIPPKASLLRVRSLVRNAGIHFEAAVLLPNSLRSALEVKVPNVSDIVGYKGHWRSKLLTQVVKPAKITGPVRHHSQHYLHMASRMGADISDPRLFDPIRSDTKETLPALRIGLCPGAEYGPAKRWPVERYAETAKRLAAETRCEWVIFGAAGDSPLGNHLSQLMDGHCLNLVGKTSLAQLCVELRRCRLLLTNDTGTMHLAALLGVPTVSIFGSTDPDWTGPLGPNHVVVRRHVECSPCFKRECPIDFRCMMEIEPGHVVAAVQSCLS